MATKGQARALNQDELRALWRELDYPHNVIAQICYFTASRVGEVVALRAEDIADGKISLRVSKSASAKTKTVAISPDLAKTLAAVAGEMPKTGYLFPSAKWTKATVKKYRIDRAASTGGKHHFDLVDELPPRQHITTHAVNRAVANAADLLGLERVSSHSFRRSMATHLNNAGVPLRAIMGITGHSSLASLTHYLELEAGAANEILSQYRLG